MSNPKQMQEATAREHHVNASNSRFWDELCGSTLARRLGIADSSPSSLGRFDAWYFDFYPYLLPFVNATSVSGRRLLEVGLGYGSLSQRLAQQGALYTGLDIAPGPVAMVNHRLTQANLQGRAVQGSVLECPFRDQSFDTAVAIGSLHHTGNLQLALNELRRVLVPGGRLFFMVYNAFSYRRWLQWPASSAQHALWSWGARATKPVSTEEERQAYDADGKGNAAPETVFSSIHELRAMMAGWSIETAKLENVGDEGPLMFLPRSLKLSAIGPWAGLDIYIRAVRLS